MKAGLARFRENLDISPVPADDDVVADIQAQAGALPGRLGREERIKDPGLCFWRNTRSIVLDFDHYPIALLAGANSNLALSVQSVYSIVDKVGPDLIQFRPISELFNPSCTSTVCTGA